MGIDDDRGIGAEAEEHGVADRDLTGIAADDVPGRGADGGQQHQRAQPLVDRIASGQQRIEERQHDQRDADIARQKRQAPNLAVPIGKLSFALQRIHPAFGFGTPAGVKARPAGEGFQHPVSREIRGRPPRPGPGSVDLGGTVEEG